MMISIQELQLMRVYRCFQTAVEMCVDRGYTVQHPKRVAEGVHSMQELEKEKDNGNEERKKFSASWITFSWFKEHFVEGAGRLQHSKLTVVGVKGTSLHSSLPLGSAVQERRKPTDESDAERLVIFFSDSAKLLMKDVLEYRHEAISHYHASGLVIVSPKVSSIVRRETREIGGMGLDNGDGTVLRSVELFEEEQLVYNPSHHETVPVHTVLSPAEMKDMLQRHQVELQQLPRISEADPMVRYIGATRGMVIKIFRQSKESGPYPMYRQVI